MDIRTFTLCINANGEAEIVETVVNCKQSQYDLGEHYDLAEEAVSKDGYEAVKSFDEHEPAGKLVIRGLASMSVPYSSAELGKKFEWLSELGPGDEVFWNDPAESHAIARILDFHDISLGFWISLTESQKEELGSESDETFPGSSGIYLIESIHTESGQIETVDSIVNIKNHAGSSAEVFAGELTGFPLIYGHERILSHAIQTGCL